MNKWTKINSVKDGYLGKTEKVNERKMSWNEQMIERKNDLENPGMKEKLRNERSEQVKAE